MDQHFGRSAQEIKLLAEDFITGWDVEDEADREYLGTLGARRLGSRADIEEAYHQSLSTGLVELDMLLARAKEMMQNQRHVDPLDGQDLLSFLSKVMAPDHGLPSVRARRKPRKKFKQPNAPQTEEGQQASSEEKRERPQESHFFTADKEARRLAKKEKRREARRSARGVELGVHSPSAVDNSSVQSTSAVYQDDPMMRESADDETLDENPAQAPASGQIGSPQNTPQNSTPQSAQVVTHEPLTSDEALESRDTEPLDNGCSARLAEEAQHVLQPSSRTPKRVATSRFFATTPKLSPSKPKSPRPLRGTVSSLPFPPLSDPQFGLIQEKLADDPFRLLVAVTFLIKTSGRTAIPAYGALIEKYPTPEAIADADAGEISALIKHLGLAVVRTAQIQKYARIWLESPPSKNVRYGVKNYPNRGDGNNVRAGEVLAPEDQDPTAASAWEIGHMTQGPYAIDSWRIFCRDVLLGRAGDYQGKGREVEFQPEWMRVQPKDKELRACLRWLWMKEGWAWDPVTGEKDVLSEELRRAVNEGRVEWDNTGGLRIVEESKDEN